MYMLSLTEGWMDGEGNLEMEIGENLITFVYFILSISKFLILSLQPENYTLLSVCLFLHLYISNFSSLSLSLSLSLLW